MIISHKNKFIFIKTQKTAGTSIEIALSKFCGSEDIITPIGPDDEKKRVEAGYRTAQNYGVGVNGFLEEDYKKKLRIIADAVRGKRPRRFWHHIPAQDVKKKVGNEVWNKYFKFTIVREPIDQTISAYYWKCRTKKKPPDFSYFLRHKCRKLRANWYIVSDNHNFILDDFIKYENMETDLRKISNKLGLTENLYDIVSKIYAKYQYRPTETSRNTIASSAELDFIRFMRQEEYEVFGY